MGKEKEEYAEYLTSDEWKRLAAQRRAMDGNKCWICGRTARDGEQFPVHHLTYINKTMESMQDLRTVCPDCHKAIHNAEDKRKEQAAQIKKDYNREVAERIKDIDELYVEKRAQLIADAVLEAVGNNKPENINSVVSYYTKTLDLESIMHRQLEARKLPSAFNKATQIVSKARKQNKSRSGRIYSTSCTDSTSFDSNSDKENQPSNSGEDDTVNNPPPEYLKAMEVLVEKLPFLKSAVNDMHYVRRTNNQILISFGGKSLMQMQLLKRKQEMIESMLSESYGKQMTIEMIKDPQDPPVQEKDVLWQQYNEVYARVFSNSIISIEDKPPSEYTEAIDMVSKDYPVIASSLAHMQYKGISGDIIKVAFEKNMTKHKVNVEKDADVMEEYLSRAFYRPMRITIELC